MIKLAIIVIAIIAFLAGGCRHLPDGVAWPQKDDSILIALQVPLIGRNAGDGQALREGATLAMEAYRPRLARRGIRLQLAVYDDSNPERGTANAELICADPRVVAVVGHLDSASAIPASERYHQYGLAFVAPTSTAPELTGRSLDNVFRLVAADDVQGRVGAEFASSALRADRIFVVHDGSVYGQGLADVFKREAEARNARVSGYRRLPASEAGVSALAEEIRDDGPDLVYFGGYHADGGRLVSALRQGGVAAAFMGGDGLDSPETIAAGGIETQGTYYTSVVNGWNAGEKGRSWRARFRERFGRDASAVAAAGYDATAVVLEAMAHHAERNAGGKPGRTEVKEAIRSLKMDGITGEIGFDERGDNVFAAEHSVRALVFISGTYPGRQLSWSSPVGR